jgi:predicted nucleic acid-binding protein
VSNPAFSRDALSPEDAAALLAKNLEHAHHEFWGDTLPAPGALAGFESKLRGHQQVTDGYLLALAHQRQGALATFDRGLRSIAGRGWSSSLDIVPMR